MRPTVECPNCGAANPADSLYCDQCSAALPRRADMDAVSFPPSRPAIAPPLSRAQEPEPTPAAPAVQAPAARAEAASPTPFTPPAARPATPRRSPALLAGAALLALGLFMGVGVAAFVLQTPSGGLGAPFSQATATNGGQTPPPGPTDKPAGAAPGDSAAAPCAVFPPDNIWNRNIAALPTHPRSDAYIAAIGSDVGLHRDFGSGVYQGAPIGIPYAVVSGAQSQAPVQFGSEARDESDAGPYPLSTSVPLEAAPEAHALIVDQDRCVLYEVYQAQRQTDGSWHAYAGARWDLRSNALRPDTWTSADAAGLPIFAGLVRYPEVAAGAIHHALRFTAPRTQQAHLWPARHDAGESTGEDLPPLGLRVRLKAGYDISPYPADVQVILQALKDYGMFLADNGSPWFITGAPDSRWDNDLLQDNLKQVHGSDFEAVDESSLMIDPNSGQSR